ncbi:MAG: hypothetical protein WC736_06415 [Gallionella sp.]|jgi:hypothetical protein
MYPVHDVDALLLLAISLASKRRPAELIGIIAACDLIPDTVFSETKLQDAFERMSGAGLITCSEEGYTLSSIAQQLITSQPKKADAQARLISIKANLAAYTPKGEHGISSVTSGQLLDAQQSHLQEKKQSGKNLFVPRPKPEVDPRRKPYPSRRRR